MRTLGQERAEFALKKVTENITLEQLKPFSAGAATMILQNGFGQALAFWVARGKDHHMFIFNCVKDWLIEKEYIDHVIDEKEFIGKISKMEQKYFLKCQKEAISLLEWVKRYANAFCKDKDSGL